MSAGSRDPEGYVFISYVRSDRRRVDQLQSALEAAGLQVWRDVKELTPGTRWKSRLRAAIGEEALAFLPCFSRNTENKTRSVMYAELLWAAEEYRLRTPSKPWIFPVLFTPCSLPEIDLGNGQTLDDLQWARLYKAGEREQLIAALLELLPTDVAQAVEMLSISCTPRRARAGTFLDLEIEVEVVGGPIVAWIGATLTDAAGREHYDQLNDRTALLEAGRRSYHRKFRIPRVVSPGKFDLMIALWHKRIGDRQLASIRRAQWVKVT